MTRTPSNVRGKTQRNNNTLITGTLLCLLLCVYPLKADEQSVKLSGFVAGESRHFVESGAGAADYRNNLSVSSETKLYYEIPDSDDSLQVSVFYRYDENDQHRTHLDLRELTWHKVAQNWELTLGIDQVFWGVTETVHLVNIINQLDQVENIDSEDLLGQPMANLSLIRDWGVVDLFFMPYFRERTFPETGGRPGSAQPVSSNDALYSSDREQWHTDFAVRWSHNIAAWDLGISYFYGTSREPRFDPASVNITTQGITELRPIYDVINQTGIDIQGTFDAWLWKLEAIHRSGQNESFFASAAGFEYTFFDVQDSGMDLGLLSEYLYDERDSLTANNNDLSAGLRLSLNDINSTELLAAVVQDLDNQSRFFFVEASRRIGNDYRLSIEARGVNNVAEQDPLQLLARDNYLQLELGYYF